MAKLADALRLGRSTGNRILVQVQLAAHGQRHYEKRHPHSVLLIHAKAWHKR